MFLRKLFKLKKLLGLLLFLGSLWGSQSFATNAVYIAQTAAGANDGTSCANAKAVSYFNTAGNWSATPTGIQIGPDTTVHLCGTFTGTAGVTMLTVQGPGTSGHPVTVLFETNAVLTAPYWPLTGGALNLNSQAFITIDGGTNGLITASANGAGRTFSLNTMGIEAQFATNAIIKNMHVTNLHVVIEGDTTSCQDGVAPAAGGYTVIGIHLGASNQLADHNFLDHVRYGIYGIYRSTPISNIEISNNLFTFTESSTIVGDGTTNAVLSGLKIHDNHFAGGNYIYDSDNTATNCFHHNGIHLWSTAAGSQLTGIQIYNNLFDGTMGRDTVYGGAHGGGTHITGVIYLETVGDNSLTFNNIIATVGTLNNPDNGFIYCKSSATPAESCRNASFYNNTIISTSKGTCAELDSTGALWKNNICVGENTAIYPPNNGSPANYLNTVTADHDDYFNVPSYGKFDSWTGWKNKGEDPNSIQTDPNLDPTTFAPLAAGHAIGAGVNLSSLGITALNSDKNGVARPSGTAAWDLGAQQFVGSGGGGSTILSASPTSGSYGSIVVGVPSSDQTFVITNIGTLSLTLSTPVTTFSNTDYQISPNSGGGTCGGGLNLAPGGTCTKVIRVTPSIVGPDNGTATFGTTTSASATVNLTATGISGTATLTLTPSSLSFGNQADTTTSTPQNVTVTNIGSAALTFPSPFVSFSNPQYQENASTTTCGSTLNAGSTCIIAVVFKPTVLGSVAGTLNMLAANAPSIPLSGNGTAAPAPIVTATPSSLTFANQTAGTVSAAQSVTIANDPAATASFSMGAPFYTITGANPSEFQYVAGTCADGLVEPSGTNCNFSIKFAPLTAGSKAATITIAPGLAGTLVIALTGTSAAPQAVLSIAPVSETFATTNVGSQSATLTLTVTNSGPVAVTFQTPFYTKTGTNPLDFIVVGGTCGNGATVPIGQGCTIQVYFKPSIGAQETATLTVTGTTTTVSDAFMGLGVASTVPPAPSPNIVLFTKAYTQIEIDGTHFVPGVTTISANGAVLATNCTPTICLATIPSSMVLLPFLNQSIKVELSNIPPIAKKKVRKKPALH
jgi:hypothetical protein